MQFKDILAGVDAWTFILWILLVVTVLLAIWRGFPWLRRFVAFINDVSGEPARPGVPARPGIMERVANIETIQKDVSQKVNTVHHEVFPNSGKSLRDQTNRIEDKVSKDYKEIGKLKKEMGELSTKLDEHLSVSTSVLQTIHQETEEDS